MKHTGILTSPLSSLPCIVNGHWPVGLEGNDYQDARPLGPSGAQGATLDRDNKCMYCGVFLFVEWKEHLGKHIYVWY